MLFEHLGGNDNKIVGMSFYMMKPKILSFGSKNCYSDQNIYIYISLSVPLILQYGISCVALNGRYRIALPLYLDACEIETSEAV